VKFLASFRAFAIALVLVAVVVIVGAPSTPTSTQRIAHLESIVRCPACTDISVAQSNAAASIAIRHEIATRVRAGQSDDQILSALESRYTANILLTPRGSGLDSLLWIVPVAIVIAGVVVFARVARRRT
jgi:cytochrome c-type biogenesis protein CcmH